MMSLSLQDIARALGGKISGGQVRAPGPGHSAMDDSLAVKLAPNTADGFIVCSHAGDDVNVCKDYVRQKLGLPAFKPNGRGRRRRSADELDAALMLAIGTSTAQKPKGKLIAQFDYRDEHGELLYQKLKYQPKGFSQRRPDGNGGWIAELDERRVLYRLPELLKFSSGTILVCEGEKDVDRVIDLGLCATTVTDGKWTVDCTKPLAGRDVCVLEDHDEPGRKKALQTAQALHSVAKSIRIVELPGLGPRLPHGGKDVSDWLDADQSRDAEKLLDVCFSAPLWEPTSESIAAAAAATTEPNVEQKPLIIKSSREFVAGFVPPEYVVVGLLQCRFFYSLTGATGAGKTAITLLLAACIALGRPFANKKTKRARVLYLAAENADDVRMRWIALSQVLDFDIGTIEVYFVEGRFSLTASLQLLRSEAERHGGDFGLVVVDTGPTFFEGTDENANKKYGDHARLLRSLIDTVPGRPCVVANCHPTKNAKEDQLIPRGGGAFINEVDGNLTAAKTDSAVELHWQGKFRGVDFAPMQFLISTVTHQDLKDNEGRLLPTVIAEHISDEARENIIAAVRDDENAVLKFVAQNPTASRANIAIAMGWKLYSGDPNKTKASRCIKSLETAKLIEFTRAGHFKLTEKGKKELNGNADH
jgi:AAA domain